MFEITCGVKSCADNLYLCQRIFRLQFCRPTPMRVGILASGNRRHRQQSAQSCVDRAHACNQDRQYRKRASGSCSKGRGIAGANKLRYLSLSQMDHRGQRHLGFGRSLLRRPLPCNIAPRLRRAPSRPTLPAAEITSATSEASLPSPCPKAFPALRLP